MVPDKTRRKKRVLGVLRRILAIKARRGGRMIGSLAMNTDIDSKVLWRMRMVGASQGENDDDVPRPKRKVKW